MTKDERELIDEKFRSLATLMNARFENIDDKLDAIHIQAIKTNGRVTKLEEHREGFQRYVDTHPVACPQLSKMEKTDAKIDKLEEKLEDIFFFIKHPKLFIAGFVIVVILSLATFLSNNPFKVFQQSHPVKTEQPIVQNNG